jgi:hypothetical protein
VRRILLLAALAVAVSGCASNEFELSVHTGEKKDQVVVHILPLHDPPGDDKSWEVSVHEMPALGLTVAEIESNWFECAWKSNPGTLPYAAPGQWMAFSVEIAAPSEKDMPPHSGTLLGFAKSTRLLVLYRGKCDEWAIERWYGSDDHPELAHSLLEKQHSGFTCMAP